MPGLLKPSAQRVQDALVAHGFAHQVLVLDAYARTAAEAAAAIGCTVAQIAKSLIFRGAYTGKPVLVIASGVNRVNQTALAQVVGEPLERADADYVREQTGFAIGGVPPFAHDHPLETYIDSDLWQYAQIWAAAGHPNAVFALTPDDLLALTGGRVVAVK